MLHRYYYTFGTSKQFPYRGGWVCVDAQNITQAHQLFRACFPDVNEGTLNCADFYTAERFAKTEMDITGNLGAKCHEVINLWRTKPTYE